MNFKNFSLFFSCLFSWFGRQPWSDIQPGSDVDTRSLVRVAWTTTTGTKDHAKLAAVHVRLAKVRTYEYPALK